MILENFVSASEYANEYPILYQTILYFEGIFLFTALPAMYFFAFLLFKTKYYSKNSIRLMMHICLWFPFYAIPEIYCIVLQLINRFFLGKYFFSKFIERKTFLGELEHHFWFKMASHSRTYYIMLGCLAMPSFAVERFFATKFAYNYEQKQRTYISTIVIIIIDICSFGLMIGRAFKWATYLPYLLIVGSSNAFAIITFLICHRKNLRYYKAKFPKTSTNYSLSLRYQIIENIRCEMMQKRLFNVAFAFTVTLGILFAIAYLFKHLLITNICYQLFDLVIAIYATVVPIIGFADERIMGQTRRIKFRPQKVQSSIQNSANIIPQKTEIKTVFGVEIVKSSEDVTKTYFNQLAQTWG